MSRFHTLAAPVEISGIGLHCGFPVRVRLLPCETAGFAFVRRDLPGAPRVRARLENIAATTHATVLCENEATVSTTEHLLAALWSQGVTHCDIELDAPEVPILDGSAAPWCEAISRVGRREIAGARATLELIQPVWFDGGAAQILAVPSEDFRISLAVDFDFPHLAPQTWSGTITAENFARELAPARTFTLEPWLQPLRDAGLIKGGSLENAVVFFSDGPSSSARMPNEQARHKALDAVGDFALLWGENDFRGHFFLFKAGHGAHREWMKKCLSSGFLARR